MLQLRNACHGTRHRGVGWDAMIRRGKIGLILLCDLRMLLLRRSRLHVRLAGEGLLLIVVFTYVVRMTVVFTLTAAVL
jgi:hypothetical protein